MRVANGLPPTEVHKSFWTVPAGMMAPSTYPVMTGGDGGSIKIKKNIYVSVFFSTFIQVAVCLCLQHLNLLSKGNVKAANSFNQTLSDLSYLATISRLPMVFKKKKNFNLQLQIPKVLRFFPIYTLISGIHLIVVVIIQLPATRLWLINKIFSKPKLVRTNILVKRRAAQ